MQLASLDLDADPPILELDLEGECFVGASP
jgi:hypothetical protein